ncbi:MAG: hypothetical protein JXA60_11480 [Candidatus Coatesbacteria bacterium]|nr:hypothetical protein [Candidatus Coatesbacteria bacterium]
MNKTRLNICFVMFLVSAITLCLELVQMRIFSFMLWHHLAYVVITVALLGFGAAGSFMFSYLDKYIDSKRILFYITSFFALSIPLSFSILARIPLDTFGFKSQNIFNLLLYYILLFIPYFFAGLTIAFIIRKYLEHISILYFVNMCGSGIGCLLMLLLLGPLTASQLLFLLAFLSSISALFLSDKSDKKILCYSVVLSSLLLILIPFADNLIPIKPAKSKLLSVSLKAKGAVIDYSRWHPLYRIDVVKSEEGTHPARFDTGTVMRNISLDGDANTWMYEKTNLDSLRGIYGMKTLFGLYQAPFVIKNNPKVLIIGSGGGNEVRVAQYYMSKDIVGVELHPVIVDLVKKRYAEFTGDIYNKPNTRIFVGEGRSFIRRINEKFDIIQMTGVDTWSGLSSGAYVLSENYLYTVDAIKDYMNHLSDDGILSIGRFLMTPPRETLRLASISVKAMEDIGIKDPSKHIIIIAFLVGKSEMHMGNILIKKTPFTDEEIKVFEWASVTKPFIKLIYAPNMPEEKDNPFTVFLNLTTEKEREDYYKSYIYNIRPVYDDKPFFFEYYKWDRFFKDFASPGKGGQPGANKPYGLFILGSLLLQTMIFSILLILLPLKKFNKSIQYLSNRYSIMIYFLCLGFAYMLIEISFMQKFILFLGYPTYSISIVLISLLISSGLGSLLSGYLKMETLRIAKYALIIVIGLNIIYLLSMPCIFKLFLGYGLKVKGIIALLMVFSVGFFMGIPFPMGLKKLEGKYNSFSSWVWGINASASVVASVLAILMAMAFGFKFVGLISSGLYFIALWMLPAFQEKS